MPPTPSVNGRCPRPPRTRRVSERGSASGTISVARREVWSASVLVPDQAGGATCSRTPMIAHAASRFRAAALVFHDWLERRSWRFGVGRVDSCEQPGAGGLRTQRTARLVGLGGLGLALSDGAARPGCRRASGTAGARMDRNGDGGCRPLCWRGGRSCRCRRLTRRGITLWRGAGCALSCRPALAWTPQAAGGQGPIERGASRRRHPDYRGRGTRGDYPRGAPGELDARLVVGRSCRRLHDRRGSCDRGDSRSRAASLRLKVFRPAITIASAEGTGGFAALAPKLRGSVYATLGPCRAKRQFSPLGRDSVPAALAGTN